MDIWQLDVDQCPDNYWVSNAFKDSHKCDRKTSYVSVLPLWCVVKGVFFCKCKFWNAISQCVPILGRGFDTGSYKCECLQGFEYPYENLITYYDGQLVESEYENIVKDKPSRWDKLPLYQYMACITWSLTPCTGCTSFIVCVLWMEVVMLPGPGWGISINVAVKWKRWNFFDLPCIYLL